VDIIISTLIALIKVAVLAGLIVLLYLQITE
jgi:hypothetical protein